jgi:error-prone DNA polymerase
MSRFVELHARSAFSFLRGTDQPAALVERAAELGMEELALCDRSGVAGAPRFYAAAREVGLRAIVGTELPMEDGSALPVLVESREGYGNLCRLLSRAKLRAPKGEEQITWKELPAAVAGLHCLSGDQEGAVRRHLAGGRLHAAEATARKLVEIFGKGRVHIELNRYRMRGESRIIRGLCDLAGHLGLPLLAANAPCMTGPENRPLLDAFTCLRHHTRLAAAGRLLDANSERHLKGCGQMAELFADIPEALRNSCELAGELDFTLADLGYEFPRYPCADGESEDSILRRETYAGARLRYGSLSAKVKRQLEHELDLIARLRFSGYFLIVWDIVQFTRRQGMLAQGRGSAANSAVCYALGITNVDPVGGKLLFERFLSEGREGWPDIDIDLPSGAQRESVIQEVYRRFGRRGAAMVANVITYRSRSAMREMGKVLDLPPDVCGRFSDAFGRDGLGERGELRDRLLRSGLPRDHPHADALLTLLCAVRGLPRHLGQHSGGMVISERGLDCMVALENASMPGRSILQWDKDDCEDLGIIKVDLLGLGMMAAIEETLQICSERGRPVDLARIPKDDPETFTMLQRADTIGLFQLESRAQQACLPRMRPEVFYDVVIQTALIRPGPIVGNLVHPYLARRRGREPVSYIDERFRPILERTLGIPLFQEQVLRMAMVIADFTGSEAEELRRALSFNRSRERMDRVMEKLSAAMTRKGVGPEKQQQIVESIRSFALYGFPESHAISFALLAYASAWLKVHRAAEFYAGLLNNQPMGFYSSDTLVRDARRHGIRVRPVCVVTSDEHCHVESDTCIRLGLKQVRHLSSRVLHRLLEARQQRNFADLEDLLLRVPMSRSERRILAGSGVLAALSKHRRDALWQVEEVLEEGDLFGWSRQRGHQFSNASPLSAMSSGERLAADYAGLGLTTGPHPMAYMRPALQDKVWAAADLQDARDGQHLSVAGMVICRQRPGTAKGHLFISLEDETGISNIFVPAATFERHRLVLTQESLLVVHGRLQYREGVCSVYLLGVERLPRMQGSVDPGSHDFR